MPQDANANDEVVVVGGVKTDADGGGEGGGAVATTPSSQQQQQQPPQVPAPMGMGGYGYQPPPGSMRAPAGVGGGAFPFPPQVMMPYGGAMGGGGYPPMMYPPPYAATAAYANPGMMMSSMMSSAAAAAAAVAALPKKLEVGTTTTITTTQICTIHPPGMPRAFDVPFPPRKLPVCVRCKKNYRSRELCRQRDEHRALPWQTTYIIVTLTEAVLEKREDGTQCIADIPVAAVLQDMPDMCRGPADGFMTKQPICKLCKDKNYTRDYCRTSSKHTTPPYQTVYIKLVPKSMADEDPLLMSMRQSKKKKRKAEEHCDGKPTPNLVIGKQGDDYLVVKEEEEGSDSDDAEEDKGDDLTQIHPSKTFFAEISAKKITVKWCEQIQYPDVVAENIPNMLMPQSPANSTHMMASSASSPYNHYMNNFMGGINTMPHHMQGPMWEAFRAGVMWAQTNGGMMPPPPPGHMPPMNYAHPDSTKNGERLV